MNVFFTFSVAGAFFMLGLIVCLNLTERTIVGNSETIINLNELLKRKNEEIEIMKHLNREYP